MSSLTDLDLEDLEKIFFEKFKEIKLIKDVSDEDKLFLYKYYKQATIGNINIKEPSFFDFIGKAKYNAWKSVENESKQSSMIKYIDKVNSISNGKKSE
mgnify:CR=1 FL=1